MEEENNMKMYIATPINSRKEPTFESRLRGAARRIDYLKKFIGDDPMFEGYDLVSTFDIKENEGCSEARAMGNCVEAVMTCDAIYLDHGWMQSCGCNLEYRAAKIYGKLIFEHDKL